MAHRVPRRREKVWRFVYSHAAPRLAGRSGGVASRVVKATGTGLDGSAPGGPDEEGVGVGSHEPDFIAGAGVEGA
jgi:hypothetical protein